MREKPINVLEGKTVRRIKRTQLRACHPCGPIDANITLLDKKTHVRLKSPYPVRNPDLSLEHRSNCGRMPFLAPPMALMGFEPTTH